MSDKLILQNVIHVSNLTIKCRGVHTDFLDILFATPHTNSNENIFATEQVHCTLGIKFKKIFLRIDMVKVIFFSQTAFNAFSIRRH